MTHLPFVEQFRDLPNIVHKSWEEITHATGMSYCNLRLYFKETSNGEPRSPHLRTVREIAHCFDLIPVVLYHTATDQPETLGMDNLLAGEHVDDYVRRVILQEKTRLRLSGSTLAWRSGLSKQTVALYETSRNDLTVRSLDSLCVPLGLVAGYFVVKDLRL